MALAPGLDRLPRQGEPAPRSRPAEAGCRGHPRHARAPGWLPPPEAGRHPAPRTTPRATSPTSAASTCATPGATTPTTAGTRSPSRSRRSTAPPRHGTTSRPPSRARRSTTSRPSSASAGRTRPRLTALTDPAGARPAARPRHLARPAAGPGASAAAGRGRHPRGAAAAHLPEPAARAGLRVRPRRRTQRGPRLHQGRQAGAVAHLRGGPVPLGPPHRRRLHPGVARQSRPAGHRRPALAPGHGGPFPHRPAARPSARDARHGGRGPRPGRDLRDREPRGNAGLRARQDLHRRRHLGDHRLRQLQPPLVDPRQRAVRGRHRREGRVRPRPAAHAGRRAPGPFARRDVGLPRRGRDVRGVRRRGRRPRRVARRWPGGPRPPGRLRRLDPPRLGLRGAHRSPCRRTSSCTTRTAGRSRCGRRTSSEEL